jgi:hypothetical protein
MKALMIPMMLSMALVWSTVAQADVVTDWNQTALRATEIANMPPPFRAG